MRHFAALHDLRQVSPARGLNQQWEVLRQEGGAEDFEVPVALQFLETSRKMAAKMIGVEKPHAAEGTGSKIMQVAETIIVTLA